MSEWKEVKLGDYIDMTNGYAFKSKSFVNRGIPVLKIKNIKTNKIIIEDIDYISADDNNPRYTIIKPNDLIITMTGNRIDGSPETWVGKVALFNLDGKYFLNQRLSIIRVKKDLVNLLFILYSLTTIDAQKYFITHATSSGGQANISPDIVKNFTIKLPSYIIQSEIAGILSSLDAKIETNNKLNEKLEEMAQAIFKSWFVDFEPFKDRPFHETELGMIPEGWEVGSIFDIAELFDYQRKPLSSMEREYMKGKYPYYGATSIMDYIDKYIFDGTYLLMGEDGSVVKENGNPYLQYVWGKFWPNNHAHVMQGRNGFSTEMLYCLLSITDVSSIVTGAVQMKISQRSMSRLLTVIPSKSVCKNFNTIIRPIFDIIKRIKEENDRLASLRDTLLPRLMSGEIKI